jgi:hypothetical protein
MLVRIDSKIMIIREPDRKSGLDDIGSVLIVEK